MSKRIDKLVNYINNSNITVDIGCDHAYAAIKLVTEKRSKCAYACDINQKPLEVAEANIKKVGLQNSVKVIKSNGFKEIDFKFDHAIIAGMGGQLISEIILNDINKMNDVKLILQPNNAYE
jgi:tRNA (adenine22-N1)-methyltransferase